MRSVARQDHQLASDGIDVSRNVWAAKRVHGVTIAARAGGLRRS